MHKGITSAALTCPKVCHALYELRKMAMLMITGNTEGETPYTLHLRCRHADLRREIRLFSMTAIHAMPFDAIRNANREKLSLKVIAKC